jgi:acyl-[acyl-carrier-protein]-phospholipid O-acyltransferase/long-chain-fatty-acid--[acyl-carrier-protein] ligase
LSETPLTSEAIAPGTAASPSPHDRGRFGFWSLIVTQFQGAFNDNAIKFLVIYIIVGMNLPKEQRDFLVLVVGALFALPFILFSMAGGWLADRYSKRDVTIGTKIMEVFVMFFAIGALALHHLPMECAAVFLISSQGALFGPSKYGSLPELLPPRELSWGNGIIELGTFVGSIGATMAAGIMAERYRGNEARAGWILLGCTVFGLAWSFGITRVPAAHPTKEFRWNPLGDLLGQLHEVARDRVLTWAVIGNTYLWFLAALLQFTVVVFGHDTLRIDETHISYLQAAIGIGIGVGSVAAGYLSGGKIEYGLIPIGAVGMTIFGGLLYRPGHTLWTAGVHLALLGFFGGFFAVPMNALIQHRPPPEKRGGVIAAANLLSFAGIFVAAGAYFLFSSVFRQTPPGVFLDGAVLTLVMTVYAIYLLPDSLMRMVLWMAAQTVYRIRVVGRENIPERGGALFVANHTSWVDAMLLIGATDRPVRFVMFQAIYDLPFIKPFAKMMKVIPISNQARPRDTLHALRTATQAIRAGEIVCIFVEGQITRTGKLLPFRRGFERIMKGIDAPIVPVDLDGVWGSIFSLERGRFLWKFPRRIPYPVTISFGQPLPSGATAAEVRAAVQQLSTDAYALRKARLRPLGQAFVCMAHRHPRRFAMGDKRRPQVRFGEALLGAIFLARRLKRVWAGQEMVGIMLPPSVPGALVNFAATLSGKIPIHLNYTASAETLESCARQCGLKTVITTRALLERLPVKPHGELVMLEDVAAAPQRSEKIVALLLWFLPGRWLESRLSGKPPRTLDDLLTVIFSSGSTGDPKGVMLTHYNVASNIEQMAQAFLLDRHDRLLGVLPFFHSFGFTVTLWLPAVQGVGVAYHPSPLDFAAVSELVRAYDVTILLSAPTFLHGYLRRCSPEDFGGLRCVVTGSEKLPERLAAAFEDRFGIRPLEGYGCTECSPVVAVNTPDYRAAGFLQVGSKRGHVGHPLPGVSVRIVDPEADPDTRVPLPVGEPGLLLVRGPNVMKGYLGRPEETAEAIRDGWYATGDIATLDEDGFLAITDRLSRFSKIGGEMIPHIRVEEMLHELAGATDESFAVAGVPDPKKGERLVVLHTLDEAELKEVIAKLDASGLPPLWLPRPNQFFHVEEFPRLGTGKLDLRGVRELALKLSGGEA